MNIVIPVYIEQQTQADDVPLYVARPLFFAYPEERAEQLSRALAKLARELRRELDGLGRALRHDRLAEYSFAPVVEDHLHKFKLDLGDRTAQCRFLLVTFEALGRRLAFTPSLPELWFEIARGETLFERAAEVLTRYFRGKETKDAKGIPTPEAVAGPGKAWTSTIEIDVHPPELAPLPVESFLALLGGGGTMDGETELRNVGRCLDWLYPDELNRVVGRDRETAELTRLLTAKDRRPVLLLGPRQAGKTALLEEYVHQTVARRQSPYVADNNVWLLAPQRLISGMSYVGQWEQRLLAIMQTARDHDHILYFDDLLGLFKAGLSRDANLSVAQVLRPFVERREFRLLGECTPEAWRVLRELDRGFADLFHVLPVNEPSADETFAMLIDLLRQLERQHRCRFALDALPAAFELQRRYVRDAAFPGKAAGFLRRLAVKQRGAEINRRTVLDEFHAKSGLAVAFLDDEAQLARREVIAALSREVIGQPAALEAVADVVCIAKARLNDPDRPLAAFLFLGPTGVGKTQCAKSLAAYLFGDAERLVRFDMNEFIAPGAAARLVGTFDQPEGLLTAAVRRQPFAVVLLDEIEKAHRDVFNLLLQVMSDGRLTDALGRTADFTHTIIILTSNLGVREASAELGFWPHRERETGIYTQAAEKFFSPEFFNRLDRIIPFARLGRDDVRGIAHKLLDDVLARDGLRRRKCVLRVDERALERIVDEGYHPQLGARALKRAVERQLTQPVAAQLAALDPATPTVISLYPNRAGLAVHVQPLIELEPPAAVVAPPNEARTIELIEAALDRLAEELAAARPADSFSLDDLRPEHYRYFTLRERLQWLRRTARRLAEQFAQPGSTRFINSGHSRSRRRVAQLKQMDGWSQGARRFWRQMFGADDLRVFLRELMADAPAHEFAALFDGEYEALPDELSEVVRELSLLDLLVAGLQADEEQVLLVIRPLDRTAANLCGRLCYWYEGFFRRLLDTETETLAQDDDAWALAVRGRQILPLIENEAGTHLFVTARDALKPVQVKLFPLAADDDAHDVLAAFRAECGRWWEALAEGRAAMDDDPFPLEPVLRVYSETGATVDWRSGLTTRAPLGGDLTALLLAGLEWPAELLDE